ncbi:hypothetical protein ERX37_01250 [Macrococcus hajekii]|uniref:DNA-binding protein n=1 Tax=Macrococcus hajekii TaxID=198482 RepID=A0A4V3BE51_9STAP|nr:helix-hairpin-helix domain-containing protein [Macrococcus hajekii]TDM02745.1 hypothetical protein ERX37_01250 [Macrococcus hajekii]GGB03523.1 hypothetical protein GCM10007190_09440 [Macrococcus hajekii]
MTAFGKIGKPATRALQNHGIESLEQVSKLTEKELLKMHGVGPKAIRILKENLEEVGLKLTGEE